MHDFLQSLAFTSGRALLATRVASAGWVQRGIMRSFGEDDVTAPYRSSPQPPVRAGRKPRIKPRK